METAFVMLCQDFLSPENHFDLEYFLYAVVNGKGEYANNGSVDMW